MAKLPKKPRQRVIPPSVSEDVRREIDAHIALSAEGLVARGWEPVEAQAEAVRRFGNVEAVAATCRTVDERQQRGLRLDALWQDLRYGARSLARSPSFVVTTALTLALGVGATAAIFSVVHGLLLRPLPYPDADRIVQIHELTERGSTNGVAGENFRDWKDQAQSFSAMASYSGYTGTVLGAAEAIRSDIARVSRDFFEVFATGPVRGRTFVDEELREGGPPAVLVSHVFWLTWLGGDADYSDRELDLDGLRFRIVGVLPAGFHFPDRTDLWVPVEQFGANPSRTAHNFRVVARLEDGIDLAAANTEIGRVAQRIFETFPDNDAASAGLVRLQDQLVGSLRQPLLLLFGASGLLLLIACTNIASSLLARGTGRTREMSVRAALGASRLRILRQLLTESALLTTLGAATGVGLAMLLIRGFGALGPTAIMQNGGPGLNGMVLLFATTLAVVTAVVFSLLPGLQRPTADLLRGLRHGGRGGSARTARAWSVLIVAETALAVVLLVGSGLLIRSFWVLLQTDPGFRTEGVLAIDLSLPLAKYPVSPAIDPFESLAGHDHGRRAQYYRGLLAEIGTIPGVRTVGLSNHVPLSGSSPNGRFEFEGAPVEEGGTANYRIVSPDYFAALSIPLLRGRAIEARDTEASPDVVVVNQALADRYYADTNPIGKRIRTGGMDVHWGEWTTIVGVVGDIRHRGLDRPPVPEYYLAYDQRADRLGAATIVVQLAGAADQVLPALQSMVRRVDPDVPAAYALMNDRLFDSVADRRFTMLILLGFAAAGLALALVGIYGVVSYSVAQRTRELGIRIAIGARPQQVRGAVVSDTMKVVAVGVIGGLLGAFLLSRVLQSMLVTVSARDPIVFAVVALAILTAAAVASYVPARRVTAIDPAICLRAD